MAEAVAAALEQRDKGDAGKAKPGRKRAVPAAAAEPEAEVVAEVAAPAEAEAPAAIEAPAAEAEDDDEVADLSDDLADDDEEEAAEEGGTKTFMMTGLDLDAAIAAAESKKS